MRRSGPNPDIRELRRLAHEINRIFSHFQPADPPLASSQNSQPEESLSLSGFSPVCCKDCGMPSILLRDLKHHRFVVCCMKCKQVSHLETIEAA